MGPQIDGRYRQTVIKSGLTAYQEAVETEIEDYLCNTRVSINIQNQIRNRDFFKDSHRCLRIGFWLHHLETLRT